ncbi:MAG: hypothetical protein GW762_05355 [Candidatus Pacebacteria bacterium]|nr:hypothetical protein [Candidatus Paceibacterota bacterium]PIR63828.1 MAG: hypothetical protein COU64_02560 [Candidatus Pacebacteria bacterium CG10_big_fil_rev_8_21_14_0_10_40_26]PIZ78800.1 MAG: hypothetical protein COY01_03310 [Candidatus Pacebacteria bacterium CG_4_10_14_0_2_um_filter_40_20]PJA68783.1 MAG: hypothetical protein CO156_03565 [Candidatus Pacebacteria bacterium CG_4_9_14_3_um_filter_40_12]PJC41160.1 MAG: hypothetical protein CO041_06050 [Candidatus Pacebacteria bacterium CG_4_9_
MNSRCTSWLKKHSTSLFSILAIFALFLAYNHTLVLNPATALTDWLDYPLIVFILEQNIKHLSHLDFANFSNISSFYPSPGGMFFTEILLVQGVVGTVLFPLTHNYITTHNLIFFLTALTNIISLQYFWSKLFKKQLIVSILSFLFLFSPYYFTMYVHFQMIGYAFFFFSAGMLLSAKKPRTYFIAGLLSGLQFLTGVYLGLYSLMFTGLLLLWKLWNEKDIRTVLKLGLIYSVGFLSIAGFFLYKYSAVKNEYAINRNPGEYVDLAMQPTDFLFNPYDSIWSRSVYSSVNAFSHRKGSFFSPGWVMLLSAIGGMYVSFKKKHNKEVVLMLLLLGWGIVAALGPRLSVNGTYYGTLLPYSIFLKFTPFFDALRGTGRWFFIIQIALLYFFGIFVKTILEKQAQKKAVVLVALLIGLYVLEIVPLTQRTSIQSYRTSAYSLLEEKCTKNDVLLEYPFSPMQPKTDITISLNYWSKMLLNQMHHDCFMVNGYSGFDPQHYLDFRDAFETAVAEQDTNTIADLLNGKAVTFIKVNKKMLLPNTAEAIQNLFDSNTYEQLFNDQDNLVLHKKQ